MMSVSPSHLRDWHTSLTLPRVGQSCYGKQQKYRSAIAAIPQELPYDAPNHCCFLHIWFTIVWRYVGNGWELLNDSPGVCIGTTLSCWVLALGAMMLPFTKS